MIKESFSKGVSCLTNLGAFYDRGAELVGEERATGVTYLDWHKTFNTAQLEMQTGEMGMTDEPLAGQSIGWVGCIQGAALRAQCPKWRALTSGFPEGSVLGLALFNIYVKDRDSGND